MKYLVVLALFLSIACSKTTTPSDTDIDCRGDDSSCPDSDVDTDCRGDDSSRPDSDIDTDCRGDDSSRPDSDIDTDGRGDDSSRPDEDIPALPDDPFEDPDGTVAYDEDFELPDNDAPPPVSCSSHKVCEDAVPKADLGYCYYNYCWEIGDIAWEITLFDFEIAPDYFIEKFPGVDISLIKYRIDVEFQSSGNYHSDTSTEDFISADKLSEVTLTMFTGTPFSYRMYFIEKDPTDGAVYDVGWYVSSKVSHSEIGNGDFTVQLEMYQGPIKVKVQGRFVAYIY